MLDRETCIQRQQFFKAERLRLRSHISCLFSRGHTLTLYPLRVVHCTHPDPEYAYHQILVTVSKRKFKKAVDRNRIKRIIREAYRRNKKLLYQRLDVDKPLLIAYIYIGNEIADYQKVENKLKLSFERLVEESAPNSKP